MGSECSDTSHVDRNHMHLVRGLPWDSSSPCGECGMKGVALAMGEVCVAIMSGAR